MLETKSANLLLAIFSLMVLISVACNLPYGIGLDREPSAGDAAAVAPDTATPTPADTPTATASATWTNTSTPQPTDTATLVVPPTHTPTLRPSNTATATPAGTLVIVTDPNTGATSVVPLTPVSNISTAPPVAPQTNVIFNGDFEARWKSWEPVALGWQPFDNGNAHFGWYNDKWHKVVHGGEQAQLIEIINDQGQMHRYGGIFQTVNVIPGAEYELTIHGLVRSDQGSGEASDYSFVMQYGIDYYGADTWETVQDWISLPFPEHPRKDPDGTNTYTYGVYTTRIIPQRSTLTLYIRGWSKWISSHYEGNFDIDDVSLVGTGKWPTYRPTSIPGQIVLAKTPTPTAYPVCSPGDWTGCGGRPGAITCPAEYVSQCGTDGRWGECIWDPGSCGTAPTATPDATEAAATATQEAISDADATATKQAENNATATANARATLTATHESSRANSR